MEWRPERKEWKRDSICKDNGLQIPQRLKKYPGSRIFSIKDKYKCMHRTTVVKK